MKKFRLRAVSLFAILAIVGCGGGGGGGGTSGVNPSGPGGQVLGALTAMPSSVALLSLTDTASVTLTESGYTGPFTINLGSCSGFVTVQPGSTPNVFTVNAVALGTCMMQAQDNHNGTLSLSVSVTTTSGTVN